MCEADKIINGKLVCGMEEMIKKERRSSKRRVYSFARGVKVQPKPKPQKELNPLVPVRSWQQMGHEEKGLGNKMKGKSSD